MASQQSNHQTTKDTIGHKKSDRTKSYEADQTRHAQDHAAGMGEVAKQKALEAKGSTARAGQAANDKAGKATDNIGNIIQMKPLP